MVCACILIAICKRCYFLTEEVAHLQTDRAGRWQPVLDSCRWVERVRAVPCESIVPGTPTVQTREQIILGETTVAADCAAETNQDIVS